MDVTQNMLKIKNGYLYFTIFLMAEQGWTICPCSEPENTIGLFSVESFSHTKESQLQKMFAGSLHDLKGPNPDDGTVTDNKIQRKEDQNLNPLSLEQVALFPGKKKLWGFGRWAEMLYNTTNTQNIYNKYNTELISWMTLWRSNFFLGSQINTTSSESKLTTSQSQSVVSIFQAK